MKSIALKIVNFNAFNELEEEIELGIPFCGGYAVGYHAIQAYLHKTDKMIAEATKDFIDGEEIVKQSRYFND